MAGWSQVLVGVDGSEGSRRALAWAAAEAREHGAKLRVLAAWNPTPPPVGIGYAGYPTAEVPNLQKTSEQSLADTVTDVLGPDHGLDITQEVLEGHPAQLLIDASEDADLVVVGCRGHGGFAGMLLGSVSQHLAAHAHGPVAVIR